MAKQELTFILNKNLGFPITEEPWTSIFSAAGIKAEATTDLAKVEQMLTEGGPNIAYVPGAGFCVMLRKGNHSEVPVVFITAHEEETERVQALKGDARTVLSKPFSEEALLNAISKALSA